MATTTVSKLSRDYAGRNLNYSLCTVGSTTNCRFGGNVEVQARFNLSGRGTNVLGSRLTNRSAQVARPSFYLHCDEKGTGQGGCGDREDEVNPQLGDDNYADASFGSQYYLADRSRYDLSYAWGMTVTGYTEANSGYYGSQNFDCTSASECRFPEFAEGSSD